MELSDEARQSNQELYRQTFSKPVQEEGGLVESDGGMGTQSGTGRREIPPLEDAPSVAGFSGPDPRLVEVAENYARLEI
jgi:hypothetical protein